MTKIIALALGATLSALLAFSAPASAQNAIGVGVGTGTATSSSNSGAVSGSRGNSSVYKNQKQAPGVGLAGLAASSGCLGSASIGGSGAGFGLGFGGTYQDDRCNAREDARLLYSMGYRNQAVQIMINHSPFVKEVMMQPVATSSRPTRYSAAAPRIGAASANGGVPDPNCKQWQFGVVGGTCTRY